MLFWEWGDVISLRMFVFVWLLFFVMIWLIGWRWFCGMVLGWCSIVVKWGMIVNVCRRFRSLGSFVFVMGCFYLLMIVWILFWWWMWMGCIWVRRICLVRWFVIYWVLIVCWVVVFIVLSRFIRFSRSWLIILVLVWFILWLLNLSGILLVWSYWCRLLWLVNVLFLLLVELFWLICWCYLW